MDNLQNDFGMIGLGVMGRNLLLNVSDHGFKASGLDKEEIAISFLKKEAGDKNIFTTTSTIDFIKSLARPRVIMMLVPAGKPVDLVLEDLLPHLDKDDIVIDGGNSYFSDTERRTVAMKERGIHFMGVGVSGGEQGARLGPSMMPGGDPEAYQVVKPIFESIAAKVNGEACVTYLGPGGAGHYVKMIHNGIEYGLMQLISEVYDLMKSVVKLSNEEIQEVFENWNKGKLRSFLIEITANIFLQPDDRKPGLLVDFILDKARQKGTGKWTSQLALDLQVPLPVIDMAVTMRDLSVYKDERIQASKVLSGPLFFFDQGEEDFLIKLEETLYFAVLITYAQGMALLHKASLEFNYNYKLKDIAKIWRGGCIIRASMLEELHQAYLKNPELSNLLLDKTFSIELSLRNEAAREVVKTAISSGIPAGGLMAALTYYDAFRSSRLPMNLIQAQRDYFGAHTYERVDEKGFFHTHWAY
ncbi:NADP-dependent phosphogluconate dehydrogenase [soil metagenome]